MEKNNREYIVNLLEAQLEDRKALLSSSEEIKKMLLGTSDESHLPDKVKERGLLVDKLVLSVERYRTLRKSCDVSSDERLSTFVNDVFKQISILYKETVDLDLEIMSLIKKNIDDVTFNLEKIVDGKHFLNDLKKQVGETPSLIDICG